MDKLTHSVPTYWFTCPSKAARSRESKKPQSSSHPELPYKDLEAYPITRAYNVRRKHPTKEPRMSRRVRIRKRILSDVTKILLERITLAEV